MKFKPLPVNTLMISEFNLGSKPRYGINFNAVIDEFRKGQKAIIRYSLRNRKTVTYEFSLIGFSEAYEEACKDFPGYREAPR